MMEVDQLRSRFQELLSASSIELFEDYPGLMSSANLIPTPNVIADDDLRLFFIGLEKGLIVLERGGRFNTIDRPSKGGRGGLLSRGKEGGWYNAEYLPQIAAYVHAIVELGFPSPNVFFELPDAALRLDVAILNGYSEVVVLGEAKRDLKKLDTLLKVVSAQYAGGNPGELGRDEPRQLAWRLWTARAPYLWLIGPGERRAYRMQYAPLRFQQIDKLPNAVELNFPLAPPNPPAIPNLRTVM